MTVIDGLARTAARDSRHQVMVAEGTYGDVYTSADVIRYPPAPGLSRAVRLADSAMGRAGLGRAFSARGYDRAFDALSDLPHTVLLHNAPGVAARTPPQSAPVLYAHNEILRGPRSGTFRSVRGVQGIITVSEWLAERTRNRVPRSLRDNVTALVNGVDTQVFAPVDRTDREGLRVLYVGRVVRDKGVDVLLDAVALADIPRLTVRVLGSQGFALSGPLSAYETQLRKRAATLSCHVEFVPFTPRAGLPAHYDWADVVALPSRWEEPCGLTLLESLASGAATVITASGGMPEVAGDSAVVVPRDDAVALADVLRDLARSPEARQDLGLRARERSLKYTWSSRSDRLNDILQAWGLPSSSEGRKIMADG